MSSVTYRVYNNILTNNNSTTDNYQMGKKSSKKGAQKHKLKSSRAASATTAATKNNKPIDVDIINKYTALGGNEDLENLTDSSNISSDSGLMRMNLSVRTHKP